ncbi:hypothetical protein [Virgibacillus doumboii]|uniref:hypothetical protein n=1 Tax=Virgibacillus doumboii TaxID=2697503 RepID=UPI0013DFA72F|nr:hypothetical protein [Virgibacillus doumboii]
MIENMEINLGTIQFVTAGEEDLVHIHFRSVDSENQLNMNGYVPVTVAEYEADASVEGLKKLVKKKVLERLK